MGAIRRSGERHEKLGASPRKARQAPSPARNSDVVPVLMDRVPGRFSTELGLHLERRRSADLFRWFLAAVLYGARISGAIATRTYHEFVRCGVDAPDRILKAGWEGLVALLGAGGYARYDNKTANKLLAAMHTLKDQYGGDLNAVHRAATDPQDLEKRLKALGPGIGDVTVQIFLRELRDIWPKAQPALSPLARLAAEHLRLVDPRVPYEGGSQIDALKVRWRQSSLKEKRFSDFESALVRLGRDYCRRRRWQHCPMRDYCREMWPKRGRGRSVPRRDVRLRG